MALPRFFKQKAPNRFDYQPIYWDPEKEAREERINRIKAELGYEIPSSNRKSSTITRGSFRNYSTTRKHASKESSRRILIIVGVLLLISYLLFYR